MIVGARWTGPERKGQLVVIWRSSYRFGGGSVKGGGKRQKAACAAALASHNERGPRGDARNVDDAGTYVSAR